MPTGLRGVAFISIFFFIDLSYSEMSKHTVSPNRTEAPKYELICAHERRAHTPKSTANKKKALYVHLMAAHVANKRRVVAQCLGSEYWHTTFI